MMIGLFRHLVWQFFEKRKLRKKGVLIHPTASFDSSTKFDINIVVKEWARIKGTLLGKGTYIGKRALLNDCSVGAFCSIGADVSVVYGRHPANTFVSTHPAFFSDRNQAGFSFVKESVFDEQILADPVNKLSVVIGNDVWIGTDVKIMEGVRIGDGAIIGACSLVTKDIEPYSINVGLPCRKVSMRFDEEEVEFLKRLEWWNYDMAWLEKNASFFSDIKKLREQFSV